MKLSCCTPFFHIAVVGLFFSSCAEKISSGDVDNDKILRSYYAQCSNGGTVYITAEIYTDGGLTIPPFKEPFGRNLTLTPPSKIKFNGQEMQINENVFGEVSYKTRVYYKTKK